MIFSIVLLTAVCAAFLGTRRNSKVFLQLSQKLVPWRAI